jgi:Zn-finger nucleic acid-binding protein
MEGEMEEEGKLCPRCRIPLAAGAAPDVTLHGCGRCGGVWLDNDDSQRAVKGLSPEALEMAKNAAENATHEADRAAWVACPDCDEKLVRTRSPSAGVDVDYCAEHGTWFDRGELATVSRAATGGLAPRPAGDPVFAPQVVHQVHYVQPRTNGLAIAGFICAFLCSLPGLIMSIIAYKQCKDSNGTLGGEGLALAGIIISIASMALGFCMAVSRH